MQAGEYQSKLCPYGYQKGKDGRMVIDEETAPVVRFIFELARTAKNAQEIVTALYEKGIPTPGEYKASKGMAHHDVSRCQSLWQRPTVLRLLADERYAGTYVIGKRKLLEVGGTRSRKKPEDEWVKIPNHHPAIIDMELFELIKEKFTYSKCVKTKVNQYPLKYKVFCGCCHHAMQRLRKNPTFLCRYMKTDPQAACYDLEIVESELEATIYRLISAQAKLILNIEDVSDMGELTDLLSEKSVYHEQIQEITKQKMGLYEDFLQKAIDVNTYTNTKAPLDIELERLKHLHRLAADKAFQMQSNHEKQDSYGKLANEIVGASGLTAALADALIEKICVHPHNHLEIVWKMNDFFGGNENE